MKMAVFLWMLGFILVLLPSSRAVPVGYTVYNGNIGIDLSDVPWGKKDSTAKKCNVGPCSEMENGLCKTGGTCVKTEDCGFSCNCPKGFSGFFCTAAIGTTETTTLVNDVTTTPKPKETTSVTAAIGTTETTTSVNDVTTTPKPKETTSG